MKKIANLVVAAILGSVFTFGAFYMLGWNERSVVIHEGGESTQVMHTGNFATSGMALPDFTIAAERTMPAVVHIKSTQIQASQQQAVRNPFQELFGDDFLFYGNPRQEERMATGSGVILSDDGYIVTNNHVVEQADKIEISLYDNRTFDAVLVGTDPSTDLAVLKITADDLVAIKTANSDDVKVGEFVLAVGNPFNLTSTVTAGIVSAKARNINILHDKSAIESFIQTDAAVNPGNSGGALVNIGGELIGINSAIASPTGSYAGYSFAIPTNIMFKVVADLKKYGVVQRGFLGVNISPLSSDLTRELDIDISEGVYVKDLMPNSSAKEAGIEAGDVIVRVNEFRVKNPSELQAKIGRYSPGDVVKITVNRKGTEKTFDVTLRNLQGTTKVVKKNEADVLNKLGASFEELSKKEIKELDIPAGIRITDVFPGKMQQAGIRKGFVIIGINGKSVESIDDLVALVEKYKGGVMVEGIYPGYSRVFYYAFGL